MYRSIIFDIGGVLVDWSPRDYLMERFCNSKTENAVYKITFGSREWAMLDRGELTRFQANQRMMAAAQRSGLTFEVQEVIDDWVSILRPRTRVLELARRLKANGYKLYYLSNIAQDTLNRLKAQGILDAFDGGIASCEVHLNKPQPEIYWELLKKYDLLPTECVFIDDSEENTRAACDSGITAIIMRNSVSALVRNLRSLEVQTGRVQQSKAKRKKDAARTRSALLATDKVMALLPAGLAEKKPAKKQEKPAKKPKAEAAKTASSASSAPPDAS